MGSFSFLPATSHEPETIPVIPPPGQPRTRPYPSRTQTHQHLSRVTPDSDHQIDYHALTNTPPCSIFAMPGSLGR